MTPDSRLIILMGPTAAGKSALAVQLAKELGGEIISADSRQIYVGMDVGTAKVQSAKRTVQKTEPVLVGGIPHYLLDILTPDQRYSAAEFRDDARRIIGDIQRRGKLPIVVGGTGFYVRAFTGEQPLPNVQADPAFRAWAAGQPVAALAAELKRRSSALYAQVDNPENPRRVTRYLEIARARGKKRSAGSTQLSGRVLKLALWPPREELRRRIEARVDEQLRRGFVEEVRRLVARYGEAAPGLQAVGYRQVFPLLRGGASFDETRAAIVRANLDYARRQLTWLTSEPNLVRVAAAEEARERVRAFLRA